MKKQDFTKKQPMVNTSVRIPQEHLERIKKERINLSHVLRDALGKLWKL